MKGKMLAIVSLGIIVLVSPTIVLAKTTTTKVTQVNPTPSPVISEDVLGASTVMKKSTYLLPYPGLLLDSPLYSLKQIRDFILERLIVDPVRKAEFYILQADKFMSMAMALADKNATVAVGKALQQADKNINRAVTTLLTLKGNGVSVPANVTDRVSSAIEKYIEVLTDLLSKVPSQKDVITTVLADLKNLQGQLPKLK